MNIDFHAHILPGADHGCKDLSMSMHQLALAQKAGIDKIVATPHFYPQNESCADFLIRREKAYSQLLSQTKGKPLPEVVLGAEVQLQLGLDRIENLDQLCIRGTNVLLLELPQSFSVRKYDQTIDALLYGRNLTVVLAHVDRYPALHVDFLLDLGCLAQINAGAMCRIRASHRCARWLNGESVVALGSDIHGTALGYRDFLRAKKRLGNAYAAIMSRTQALLENKDRGY